MLGYIEKREFGTVWEIEQYAKGERQLSLKTV
jgi:hypothetical protein